MLDSILYYLLGASVLLNVLYVVAVYKLNRYIGTSKFMSFMTALTVLIKIALFGVTPQKDKFVK